MAKVQIRNLLDIYGSDLKFLFFHKQFFYIFAILALAVTISALPADYQLRLEDELDPVNQSGLTEQQSQQGDDRQQRNLAIILEQDDYIYHRNGGEIVIRRRDVNDNNRRAGQKPGREPIRPSFGYWG